MYKLNIKKEIYEQYGIIHGSGGNCDGSHFPGIYTKVTNDRVLEFLESNGTKSGNLMYEAKDKKSRHICNLQQKKSFTFHPLVISHKQDRK